MSEKTPEIGGTAQVALVGAGPIGVELAVALKRAGVDYQHFEAGQLGHTLTWWPRDTIFFSSPERIMIAGVPLHTAGQRHPTGEEYLAYLRAVAATCEDMCQGLTEATVAIRRRRRRSIRAPDHSWPRAKDAMHMLGNAVCPPVAADIISALRRAA